MMKKPYDKSRTLAATNVLIDTHGCCKKCSGPETSRSNPPLPRPSRVGYFSLDTTMTATTSDAKEIISDNASATVINPAAPPFIKGVATAHPA